MIENPRDAKQQAGLFDIRWQDRGREPQCPPNPDFPLGKDVDLSEGAMPACRSALPYPARRGGLFVVRCETCGFTVGVTTAGRPDDPRSLTIACKPRPEKVQ